MLLDSLQTLKQRLSQKEAIYNSNLAEYDMNSEKLVEALTEERIYRSSKLIFQKYIDHLYSDSFKEIIKLVNHSLKFVFYDKDYSFDVDLSEAHKKSIVLRIFDDDKEINMRNSGKGVKSVISFVFYWFFLKKMKLYKFMSFDESLAAISNQYRDRFFDLIKKVLKQDQIIMLLNTHDTSITPYADVSIELADGNVVSIDKAEESK